MKACVAMAVSAAVLSASAAAAWASDPSRPSLIQAHVSQIIGPKDGARSSGGGGENRVIVAYEPGVERDFAMMESTVPGGYVTPWPMHFHTRYDEFMYILEGAFVTDKPDGSKHDVPAGAANYSPRLHPHRVSAPGQAGARLLSVATAEQLVSFKDAWQYADDPVKLADYLQTTGTFFLSDAARIKAAGAHPIMSGSILVPPDQGRTFTANGAKVRMLADVPAGEERSYAIMHQTLPAGYRGWPAYYSCNFDELWYVLDGAIAVDVGGEQKLVTAGGAVYSPRGAPHRLTVPGPGSAKVFAVVSAGQLPVIEGAGPFEKDPAKLRLYLANSQIHLADRPGACTRAR